MDKINPNPTFATFDLGTSRAIGIVKSKEEKTIRVEVVKFEHNEVTEQLHTKQKGKTIKRHITKHNVKFLPYGFSA